MADFLCRLVDQEKLRERDETPSSSSRDQRSYGRERDYTSRSSGGGERERHSSRELNYSERASGSRSRTAGGVYDDDRERSSRRESDATRTSTRKERERDQPIDEREAKVRRLSYPSLRTTNAVADVGGATSIADEVFPGWASRHWQRVKGEPSTADLEEGEI